VRQGSSAVFGVCLVGGLAAEEDALRGVVCDEEERGAGGGSDERGSDAPIYAAETASAEEVIWTGLETGFERVEGEKGEVNCCAG
jgi:hypothetical protein